jgi:hypothetical protein
MDDKTIAASIEALAIGNEKRSETARVRKFINEIEMALAAGVSRAAILEKLNDGGIKMNMSSFSSALHRIRQKNKNSAIKVAPRTVSENTVPVTTPPTKGTPGVFIHDSNANPDDVF